MKMLFSKMFLGLILILPFQVTAFLDVPAAKVSDYVEFVPMTNSGMYYEPVKEKLSEVSGIWTVVLHTNIPKFWRQISDIGFFVEKKFTKLCPDQKAFFDAETYVEDIDALRVMLPVINDRPRQRRATEFNDNPDDKCHTEHGGLLNFAGTLQHWLYGTMDARDAEYLYCHANRTDLRIASLASEMVKLSYVSKQVNQYFSCQKIKEQIAEAAKLARTTIDNLKAAINSAIQFQSYHQNVIKPLTLLKTLKEIALVDFEKENLWPVEPLTTDNFYLLQKAIKMHAVYNLANSDILFYIKVPRIFNAVYKVYHPIPIPLCNYNSTCALIQPKSKYIGFSGSRYIRMENFEKCKDLDDISRVCYNNEVVNKGNYEKDCDVELYLREFVRPSNAKGTFDVTECDVRVAKFKDVILDTLTAVNQYIYVLQKDSKVTVRSFYNEFDAIIPRGVGVIHGRKPCKIVFEQYQKELKISSVSSGIIDNNLYINMDIDPLGMLNNLTLSNFTDTIAKLDDDFAKSSKTMKEIMESTAKEKDLVPKSPEWIQKVSQWFQNVLDWFAQLAWYVYVLVLVGVGFVVLVCCIVFKHVAECFSCMLKVFTCCNCWCFKKCVKIHRESERKKLAKTADEMEMLTTVTSQDQVRRQHQRDLHRQLAEEHSIKAKLLVRPK